MTIRRMRIARETPKATDTHTEHVRLIIVSPQKWLRERASILRYTCIVLLRTWYLLLQGRILS